MANRRDDLYGDGELSPGRLAASALPIGGFLFGVVATVWLIARIAELSSIETPLPTAAGYAAAVTLFVGAWALALLLWAAAQMLRRLEELHAAQRGGGHGAGPQSAATAAAIEAQARRLEELVYFTRDLRDIALLTDAERAVRAQAESAALARQLEREVPALLREHKWQEAQRRVMFARARFPSLAAWDALAAQVEQARAKFEAHDTESAQREIDGLVALGAWDRALQVVRELQNRHPDSQRVANLTQQVEEKLNRAAGEERARLMSKAQEATDKRNWREALTHVEMLIEKFPRSPEARDLRMQLPTLRANAEIQHRQQMEHEIVELLRQQRFADALGTARELIGRYPDSPQANKLRPQLPRLEEKAGEVW